MYNLDLIELNFKRRIDSGHCSIWLGGHQFILWRYIREKYMPYDWQSRFDYFMANSTVAYWVLQDYIIPREVKLEIFMRSLIAQPYIVCLIDASPGAGKTACMLTILQEYQKRTKRRLYQIGSEIPCSLFSGTVYDLNDIPEHCDGYCDEAAKQWQSRSFNSAENKRLTDDLTTLRHRDVKLFAGTQQMSLVDVNLLRFASHKLFKWIENPAYEREQVISDLFEIMRPQAKFNKSETLLIWGGINMTFELYPNPVFFSEAISKNSAVPLSQEQIRKKVTYLFKIGYTLTEASERIKKDHKVSISKSELEQMQKEVVSVSFIKK